VGVDVQSGVLGVIYYVPITVLLSLIEAWRIKRVWGKVGNINHWLTYLTAAIGFGVVYLITKPEGWHIVFVSVGCIGIRGLLFDVFLNIFRREKLDYVSNSSNSLNEDRLTKIPFVIRRIIAAVILVAAIVANHFIQ